MLLNLLGVFSILKIICESPSDSKRAGEGVRQLLPTLNSAGTRTPAAQAFTFTGCSLKHCALLFPQNAVLAT